MVDPRLRGEVDSIGKLVFRDFFWHADSVLELEIDRKTGMKNYIANESLGIDTSSAYIRKQLSLAIERGRMGKQDENTKHEALRHLGAALHTLEGRCCILTAGLAH